MDQPDRLSLMNLANGALAELFEREVQELTKNIKDPNTDPEATRTITVKVSFKPFPDRSGALTSCTCSSKVANVEPVDGQVFFARQEGELRAFARDPRQNALFSQEPAPPQKQ